MDDLSFYVDPNEIRVIIGPNGAGKTTVLDLICGRTRATSGSIKFRGKELTEMKEHQIVHAGVGRKFQNPSIYEDLTVFENLEISFPRGRSVFGALTFRRDRRGPRAGGGDRRDDLPGRSSGRSGPSISAMARSSGWRSACC